jgi:ABC-2 type transport system ATP-binding protein
VDGDSSDSKETPVTYAVDVRGLTKRYGEVTAVAGVDLRIPAGRIHGLLGPNGAGKSTLLRMLFGLIRPDGGALSLLGRTSGQVTGPALLDGVAGFVETPCFYPYLSGRRNLELLAGLDGTAAGTGSDKAISRAIERAGLLGRDGRKVGGYSFGMRQRLGIAAALLRDPRLLILDEPANGLDPAGLRDMRTLIRELGESGLTVLLSSHNMDEIETLCDSVTIMRTGGVVYDGSIDALRAQAPAPGHRLRTGEDRQAMELASTHPRIRVEEHHEGGLSVRADQQDLDAYVIALAGAGIPVRALQLVQTPLETLFSMLTEDTAPAEGAGHAGTDPAVARPTEGHADADAEIPLEPAGNVSGGTR